MPPSPETITPAKLPALRLCLVSVLAFALAWHAPGPPAHADGAITIAAVGDSLTAGHGLNAGASFPAKLATALKSRGHKVVMHNAGVSGDTASGGLFRLAWSVPDTTDAVILELGANDALRGIDTKRTFAALDKILDRLGKRKLPVLLTGMLAPPNMGVEYAKAFNAIYPALARKHKVVFYPFFLKGVAAKPSLNQADGIHPNTRGVDVIVRNILPFVEKLLLLARQRQ